MKRYVIRHRLAFLLPLGLLLLPTGAISAPSDSTYKCWVYEDVRTCDNVVPAKVIQELGFEEFNRQGVLINTVKPAPTAAEIAEEERQKAEEDKRKQQAEEDRALLDLFSTEQDIERSRVAILATIDGNIHSIETIVTSLEKNLSDMEKNWEDLKESKNDNPEISESQLQTIQKNIEDVKYRIKSNRETLQGKAKEKEATNKEYDEYLRRYRDIKRRGLPPKEEEAKDGVDAPPQTVTAPAK